MNTVEDRTLEALVDGELEEAERAAALRRLDQDADGWRRLGLAFLADQELRRALAAPTARELETPRIRDVIRLTRPAVKANPQHRRRSMLLRWSMGLAASAACALLIFMLGTLAGRATSPLVDSTPPAHPAGNAGVAERKSEAPTATPPKQVAAAMPNLSASTRRELERRGFVVNERPRVVSVKQDGRTIQVLVNEIELRFVGRHSAL